MTRGNGELIGVACEKPLARNFAEAKRMVELIETTPLLHGYLENQVFAPSIVRGKEIVWRSARNDPEVPILKIRKGVEFKLKGNGITFDGVFKTGHEDSGKFIHTAGIGAYYDRPKWFWKLYYDPHVNFTSHTMVRTGIGLKF